MKLQAMTSLVLLPCLGVAIVSACGSESACEESLSCDSVNGSAPQSDGGESDPSSSTAGAGGGNGSGGSAGEPADAASSSGGEPSITQPDADLSVTAMPDSGPDGGQEVVPPPVCGVSPVPGCVASTDNAVFVSAGVAESGAGTQASPVKTIAEGIALARSEDALRIVVCNGVYEEPVSLTVDDSGRSLTGGYNCDDWLYNPDGETLVRPLARGYALEVAGTTARVTISSLTFDAMAAVNPGESSIAAFVHEASDVRLNSVRLIAHEGQAAADDATTHEFVAGVANEWPLPTILDGNDGLDHTTSASPSFVGGASVQVTCPGAGITQSGAGGGKPDVTTGQAGALPAGKGGAGGDTDVCDVCSAGVCGCEPPAMQAGLAGDPGADGPGASAFGWVSSSGWEPAMGEQGAIGGPGGGGGGGDSTWDSCYVGGDLGWYGGGGGAAGGCGGNGGAPGLGGGSSIAMLILDSTVRLTNCALSTASAGAGSAGANGQQGQDGGAGGQGISSSSFSQPCDGGSGGKGGTGGPGGGGAGGISAGLVWAGDFEPEVGEDTTHTPGEPGAGGIGGNAGIDDGTLGSDEKVVHVSAG